MLEGTVSAASKYSNPYGEGRIKIFTSPIEIIGCQYNSDLNKIIPELNIITGDKDEETIIVAIYTANGVLEKVLTENKDFAENGTNTTEFDISSVPAGEYTYKVMVWNSILGQIPKNSAYIGNIIISK